jgi:hypothetical protein
VIFLSADYTEHGVGMSNVEMKIAICHHKRKTSCSEDCLLNKLFKDCKYMYVLLPHLPNLLNSIFSSGCGPDF